MENDSGDDLFNNRADLSRFKNMLGREERYKSSDGLKKNSKLKKTNNDDVVNFNSQSDINYKAADFLHKQAN